LYVAEVLLENPLSRLLLLDSQYFPAVVLSQKGHLTDAFSDIGENTTSMMRKKRSH